MIVSESKIDSSYPNSQFTISGYELHRNDRKKGGGGILAYVSSELICKRIKPVKSYKTIEVIVLDIQLKAKSIIVIGLYRPPKSFTLLYRQQLEEELNHICNWANLQRQSIVLLGDLNLDRLRPTSNEGKLLFDLQETHELECLISKPTRVQKIGERVSETLIDVILTNLPDGFIKSGVFDPGLSDHALVYAFMKERVVKFKTKVVNFRSCKNLDEQVFRDHLASAPWHVAEVFDDVDDQSEFFSLLLKNIVDEHMPWKRMRVRDGDVPYMTTEWKEIIRRRKKALKRFHKTKAPEDWELHRKLRNEATRLRRKAIKCYWNRKSEDLRNKPHKFYRTFTPFLGSKKVKESLEMKLKINNLITTNQLHIAESMGDYFSSIADNIGSANDTMDYNVRDHESIQAIVNYRMSIGDDQFFNFKGIRISDVVEILKDIDPKKATGWDTIPPKAFKMGSTVLAVPLCALYNRCIESCHWPKNWKRGEWVPVHKKNDRLDMENYRPVSVQTIINKVFEKLLANQITAGFNERLSDYLTAYRKRHSCETTLLMLTEKWKNALDNGESVGLLSTNMSKAFDCLNHRLLLGKLEACGFDTDSIRLMSSYFKDRFNRLKIGETTSSWKCVRRGFPQGSSFGPLLWNLFQNDLTFVMRSNVSMFADDHQFYEMDNYVSTIQTKLQDSALKATSWYKSNSLKGNFGKYGSMLMSRVNKLKDHKLKLNVNGTDIKSYDSITLLGVDIDNALNFSGHISNICKKSSQRVG